MRLILLLAVISGCAWTNQATVEAQKRAEAEKADPKLREERLARESEQNRRERAAVARALGGFAERRDAAPERKKIEMKCTQDPSYPGMPGEIRCKER